MKFEEILTLFFVMTFSSAGSWALSASDQINKLRQSSSGSYLLPHKPIYIFPLSYNDNPNESTYANLTNQQGFESRGEFVQPLESEFQISFLVLTDQNIFGSGFDTFIGYTNRSWWQVYNSSWSRPFRETNHTPEIFARKIFSAPTTYYAIDWVGYDFGFAHESNGQIQELSRSWNRLFLRIHALIGSFVVELMPWYRIPDSPDENADIEEFKGQISISATVPNRFGTFSLEINPGTHKRGFTLSHSYHWKEGLEFFAKVDYGYGHSLLDYSNESRRLGIGIKLLTPFSSNPAIIQNE